MPTAYHCFGDILCSIFLPPPSSTCGFSLPVLKCLGSVKCTSSHRCCLTCIFYCDVQDQSCACLSSFLMSWFGINSELQVEAGLLNGIFIRKHELSRLQPWLLWVGFIMAWVEMAGCYNQSCLSISHMWTNEIKCVFVVCVVWWVPLVHIKTLEWCQVSWLLIWRFKEQPLSSLEFPFCYLTVATWSNQHMEMHGNCQCSCSVWNVAVKF